MDISSTISSNTLLITPVIPHHRDDYKLLLSVQSAFTQIYQPLGIIVIDDDDRPLSADSSSLFFAHSRIIELRRYSGAPALPRNIAIGEAMGHYVPFLDVDDFWLPNHLKRMVDVWKRSPTAIVHRNLFCWGESFKHPLSKGTSYSQ